MKAKPFSNRLEEADVCRSTKSAVPAKAEHQIRFRSNMAVPGVVLLRVDPEKQSLKWRRLEAAIARYGEG